MKKVTKTSIKKKLDKIFSLIVRKRGYCAKCDTTEYKKLQCAHIFSRSRLSVRWDLDNAICLCFKDHFHWAHREPILFAEFVKNYLGRVRYNALKQKASMIKKWTLEDLKELYEILKGYYEKM